MSQLLLNVDSRLDSIQLDPIQAPPPIRRQIRDYDKEEFEVSKKVGQFTGSTAGERKHKEKENIHKEKNDEKEFSVKYHNLILKTQN